MRKLLLPVFLLFCLMWIDSVFAAPRIDRIIRDDVAYALQHGHAIVEAKVGAGKRYAVGTRSEGYRYPLRITKVLLRASADIVLGSTYDYHNEPALRPGRYLLILQPGPYSHAECLVPGSSRVAEVSQWIQRPQDRK